jgi:hypothetical protein
LTLMGQQHGGQMSLWKVTQIVVQHIFYEN